MEVQDQTEDERRNRSAPYSHQLHFVQRFHHGRREHTLEKKHSCQSRAAGDNPIGSYSVWSRRDTRWGDFKGTIHQYH